VQNILLDGLNPEQQRAVQATEGPLLILAGAGSGKTKTLTHRVAYLISEYKATSSNILAVTFTNKAAKEMRTRVAELLNANADHRGFMPYMGTFHGICVRLLRQDGEYIGIASNFVIFDESDRQALVKRICKQQQIDEKQHSARAISSMISSAKNELVSASEFAGTASSQTQKIAAKVFPLYERELRSQGALDFDDLIGRTVSLLQNNSEIQKKWQNLTRMMNKGSRMTVTSVKTFTVFLL
jgi:DNA helicase-2/ATP-dependent DNA helicase PcrA